MMNYHINIIEPGWEKFIAHVLQYPKQHSITMHYTIERFLNMKEKADNDSECPYYFTTKKVDHIIKVFSLFRHPRGPYAKRKFGLNPAPWQEFCLILLYGFRYKHNDANMVRRMLAMWPKKRAKSTFFAALELYTLIFDTTPSKKIYSAAIGHTQAMNLVTLGTEIYLNTQLLRELKDNREQPLICYNTQKIYIPSTSSVWLPLHGQSDRWEGLGSLLAIVDELHVHPNSKIWYDLVDSTEQLEDDLVIGTSFASYEKDGTLIGELYDYSRVVIDPTDSYDDPEWASMILELDQDTDDVLDVETYKKAIYLLHPYELEMRGGPVLNAYKEISSCDSVNRLGDLLRKRLNFYTNIRDTMVPYDQWKPLVIPTMEIEDLVGKTLFLGYDASSVIDLTSLTALWVENTKYYSLTIGWIPDGNLKIRSKKDATDYQKFISLGELRTCQGRTINYTVLFRVIEQIVKHNNVVLFGYDPKEAAHTVNILEDRYNLECLKVWNTHRELTRPINFVQEEIATGNFFHCQNSFLDSQIKNTGTDETTDELKKIARINQRKKIDYSASLLMACSAYLKYLGDFTSSGRSLPENIPTRIHGENNGGKKTTETEEVLTMQLESTLEDVFKRVN